MENLFEYDEFNEKASYKEEQAKKLKGFQAAINKMNADKPKVETPKAKEPEITKEDQAEAKNKMDDLLKHFDPTAVFSDNAKIGDEQISTEREFKRLYKILDDHDKKYVASFLEKKFKFKID